MSKTIDLTNKTVLISRTDSIGDVILTLPLCLWIKEQFPTCRLIFLGRSYTQPVLACVAAIDEIICWDEFQDQPPAHRISALAEKNIDTVIHVFPHKDIAQLAQKAKIPHRIGTSHRAYHLLTCNHRVNFTRKKSENHESQLNFHLLRPFGLKELPEVSELTEMLTNGFKIPQLVLPPPASDLKQAILLHPKSQGSALEWPLEKYITLANELLNTGKTVVFTGTETEGKLFRTFIPTHPNCYDLTGKLTLPELICFIAQSEALVACSTGPYHLAGILGIKAIGLFSSRKPIHPGRWKALGKQSQALVFDPACPTCAKGKNCSCITGITVQDVLEKLL